MASSTGGRNSRGNTAKALVSDQISQAVLSTSNLLHLMQQSSPSQGLKNEHIGVEGFLYSAGPTDKVYFEQYWKRLTTMQYVVIAMAQLIKLPKNLLVKTSTIKNTGQLLGQMPRVISSLDAHMENGLQSVPHLQTVIQLLENMESCQLSSLSQAHVLQEEHVVENAKVG